ncbi:hypothetical protein [Virgisporangium ochraceum]|uniref:hypothetical protein n=1 Tax=Virgisporangium ochraceum TaxID=65505 RepID=UPI0019404A43|nr:hypothetical protein [Virgisporangium ochraceum]
MTCRRALLALLLPFVLVLGGCGLFNSDDAANAAVDTFLGKLSDADYAGAAALVCAPSRSRTTADSLEAEFDRYPRPWTFAIDASSYGSGDSGTANVTITPAGAAAQQYSVGLIDENGWEICDITSGWL